MIFSNFRIFAAENGRLVVSRKTKTPGHQRNSSKISTVAQQARATRNKSAPSQAAAMPMIRAAAPETGLWVASRMAGKVITARVT